MKRVVITGLGVISSIGQNKEEVLHALQQGQSGLKFHQEFKDMGFRSHVAGSIDIDLKEHIDRKAMRFMGDAPAYAHLAMQQAITDAQLTEADCSNPETGLIVGTGGTSSEHQVLTADTLREKGLRRVSSYTIPRIMGSTASACLATHFKIKGLSYSMSSACATSSHCIGHAFELIQSGKQKRIFAGGAEELHWTLAVGFDAMGALSTSYNETPEQASRAYDQDRDGFVISAGAGILVLEDYETAQARGAKIYAEVIGYSATSDGADMVAPSGEGAVRCMRMALDQAQTSVDYINTHGTSTPRGDTCELSAIQEVFSDQVPAISSTKSMTGHAIGAAGAHESIYSLLMLEHGFIAPSINIDQLDAQAAQLPIITETQYTPIRTVMSNSFGFGGTNACLIFKKFD